jgi:cytochrome d ubiquinol oxidase subunit I
MQNPVGYTIQNNRAELVDFTAFLTNAYSWLKFFHTILAGYVVGAFFVLGISAWHILRGNNTDLFKRSFKAAATFGLASAFLLIVIGDFHGPRWGRSNPRNSPPWSPSGKPSGQPPSICC